MDWNQILQQIVIALVPIVLGVVTMLFKRLAKAMQASDHAIVQTIGELAYREVERQMEGVNGQEKMKAAIQQARTRLDRSDRFKGISDDQIIDAIQRAWQQNEGQYK